VRRRGFIMAEDVANPIAAHEAGLQSAPLSRRNVIACGVAALVLSGLIGAMLGVEGIRKAQGSSERRPSRESKSDGGLNTWSWIKRVSRNLASKA